MSQITKDTFLRAPIKATREDGKVGVGVYVAYDLRHPSDGPAELCRMYMGTRPGGPILQWDADGTDRWTGRERHSFPTGAWTPLYSRGAFGRNYACGGHWSGHTLHLRGVKDRVAKGERMILLPEARMMVAPPGISDDGTLYDLPCEGGWAIWYATASEALAARLGAEQIAVAPLPKATRDHLAEREGEEIVRNVRDVLDAYKLR